MFDLSVKNTAAEMTASEITTTAAVSTVDVDGRAMIADLSSATTCYCSILPETVGDKIRVYNAMSNADEKLRDHVGETINIRNVFVEAIRCTDEKTGETSVCPRIVLIDRDGRTFQAVSQGIFGSLKQLFNIFGEPSTWNFAITVKVRETTTRRGYRVTILEAVGVVNDDEPTEPAKPAKKK